MVVFGINVNSRTTATSLVALSYDESFDERNLVCHDDVMKKYAKWLEG
jgi:hypothetical protein